MSTLKPQQIYQLMVNSNQEKKTYNFRQTIFLSFIAGMYISLGGLISTLALTGTIQVLGYGLAKIISGVVFSLGLILVVIAGGQLFTGNILIWSSVLEKKVKFRVLLKNWLLVYLGNLIGSLFFVILIYYSGLYGKYNQPTNVGQTSIDIFNIKINLTNLEVFIRAIIANWLVCLGIYLSYSSKNLLAKIVGIMFPVMTFVATGMEHSIANMYLLPIGGLINGIDKSILLKIINNIFFATIGNILGGSILVANIYYFVFSEKNNKS